MHLAIVIPTLDEEAALGENLQQAVLAADTVIVSDGGSRDRSRTIAVQRGAVVVCGEPGRGGQLNRGARAAMERGADVILFLHADTRLPDQVRQRMQEALATGVGGGFLVRFDTTTKLLQFGAKLINLRTRLFRVPLGDQAQFITSATLKEMEGFRDWPILEDLDLILRMRRYGKVCIISDPVTTAARRFVQRGVLRTVCTNWLIWLLFLFGVAPQRLVRLYRHIR